MLNSEDPPLIADAAVFLARVAESLTRRARPEPGEEVRLGLDLGTSSLALTALGRGGRPLAAARRFASAARDGLVVDFDLARRLTAELKAELEAALGRELTETALAVPPGTSGRDTDAHRYVALAAGLEPTAVLDEPSAANLAVGLEDGVLVDIGGGTTGAAVISGGRVVHAFDEPTGGVHMTLVLAGHFKISFEEAELLKLDPARAAALAPLTAPVLSKMGRIVARGLAGRKAPEVVLVGGGAAAPGAEDIIGREVGRPVRAAPQALWATPAGIALSAFGARRD